MKIVLEPLIVIFFLFYLPQPLNVIPLSGASLQNAHRPAVADYLITRRLT